MKRSIVIAYTLTAVFVIAAVVDLALRPLHYERTLVVAVILAAASGAYGRRQSTTAEPK